MSELDPVLKALESRAWYPFAAALLTLVIALWRNVQPAVWDLIPRRWQWVPVTLLGAAAGFVDAEVHGASLMMALVMALYASVSGGMTAIGFVHTYKRVKGPDPDGST